MELITYVDPRKVKVRVTEEESNSDSDSDDWLSTQHGSRSKRSRSEYWSDIYDEQKYRKRVSRVRLNEALSRVQDCFIEMNYSWNDPILPNHWNPNQPLAVHESVGGQLVRMMMVPLGLEQR